MSTNALSGLVGADLEGFKVVQMTEVYRINEDGHKSQSLGFFRNADIAIAFAGSQVDKHWHKTELALVLTNGSVGYVISQQEPIKLFNDEQEALGIKKKAIAKLSPAERRLLGFEG